MILRKPNYNKENSSVSFMEEKEQNLQIWFECVGCKLKAEYNDKWEQGGEIEKQRIRY